MSLIYDHALFHLDPLSFAPRFWRVVSSTEYRCVGGHVGAPTSLQEQGRSSASVACRLGPRLFIAKLVFFNEYHQLLVCLVFRFAFLITIATLTLEITRASSDIHVIWPILVYLLWDYELNNISKHYSYSV